MADERRKQLEALRDRLAKAKGPDRRADVLLADMIELPRDHGGGNEPRYTTSLDAAVTLVPVRAWGVSHNGDDALCSFHGMSTGDLHVCAATTPLALCLARVEYELAKDPANV